MARKIFSGLLVALSAIFLLLSVAGICVIWLYNDWVTQEALARLQEIDLQLGQAEATLASSEKELQRALLIVDSAEAALEKLSAKSESADNLFESIQSTLDDRLIPELKTTRTRIESARTSLESLQAILEGVTSFLPIDLTAQEKTVTDLIASTHSIDAEIANVEALAAQASTFVSDTSYLLGGDLSETRDSLQNFIDSIQDYKKKIEGWREQNDRLIENAPKWIDQASISLTIFLLWFGLSQFGLLVHGLSLQRGYDPFVALRHERVVERVIPEEDIDLELGA